jgi:hypothetical protein
MTKVSTPRRVGRLEKAITRHGRYHDIESVRRIAAGDLRIREKASDLQHLEKRPRPAVSEDDRQWRFPAPPRMNEVDFHALGFEAEVRQPVPLGFASPPVEAVHPVVTELARIIEVQAVSPAGAGNGVGPACMREAPLEITEGGFRDTDSKRLDGHTGLFLKPS